MNKVKNDDLCLFTVITLDESSFPRGAEFEKQVSNLNTPEELLEFFRVHKFLPEEFLFFVRRTDLIYGNITGKMVTDNLFAKTSILFRILLASAKSFCEEFGKIVSSVLKSFQETFDVLFETRSGQINNLDYLYDLAAMSFGNKVRNLIFEKITIRRLLNSYYE